MLPHQGPVPKDHLYGSLEVNVWHGTTEHTKKKGLGLAVERVTAYYQAPSKAISFCHLTTGAEVGSLHHMGSGD